MCTLLLPVISVAFRMNMVSLMKNKILVFWSAMCVMFPLVVVWVVPYILSLVQLRPFNFLEEFLPRVQQTLLAALPFVSFALFMRCKMKGSNPETINGARWAGVGVFGFISSLWGAYYFDSFRRSGGVNIGLGLLLLISPICSIGVMMFFFGIGRVITRWRQRDAHSRAIR